MPLHKPTEAAEHHASIIRDMIKHENELRNYRMSWFGVLQGLLWAALGLGFNFDAKSTRADGDDEGLGTEQRMIVSILAIIGIYISIAFVFAFQNGNSAIIRLIYSFDTNVKRNGYVGYDVIGYHHRPVEIIDRRTWIIDRIRWMCMPFNLGPCIFAVAWGAVITIVWLESIDKKCTQIAILVTTSVAIPVVAFTVVLDCF